MTWSETPTIASRSCGSAWLAKEQRQAVEGEIIAQQEGYPLPGTDEAFVMIWNVCLTTLPQDIPIISVVKESNGGHRLRLQFCHDVAKEHWMLQAKGAVRQTTGIEGSDSVCEMNEFALPPWVFDKDRLAESGLSSAEKRQLLAQMTELRRSFPATAGFRWKHDRNEQLLARDLPKEALEKPGTVVYLPTGKFYRHGNRLSTDSGSLLEQKAVVATHKE